MPPTHESKLTCRWCEKSFAEEDARRRVCPDCARLLTGAGLSDEEIYGPPDGEGEEGEGAGLRSCRTRSWTVFCQCLRGRVCIVYGSDASR
jgi:hypothetical protein